MPVIGWNESAPQGSDSLGLGDDEIRSLKTSLRQGLDGEHIWPSAGGDAGVHRLGSARPYIGTQSLVSSTGTDGRLQWTSDTSQFFHVGSGGTAFIGGARAISAGSYPNGAAPQRYQWAMEFGTATTGALGVVTVSIPNSGFSSVPYISATHVNTGSGIFKRLAPQVASKTGTQFVVASYDNSGVSAIGDLVDWLAVGFRTL